jgi:hypothetical protein
MARLGRQQITVTAGATDTLLIGSNPSRKSLIVSAPPTNRITLSFGSGPAVLDSGINLNPGSQSLKLGYEDIGDAIIEEVHVISAVAAQTIGAVEIMGMDWVADRPLPSLGGMRPGEVSHF